MQEIINKVKEGKELTEEEKRKLVARVEKQDIRYGLVWEDHPEDVELLRETHSIVAKELVDLRIEEKEGQKPNLLLEGDNLHSLELLKDSGVKVDVIYIDPPYNTLNEKGFAYNDKMIDQNDIFRHSKWLSFMEKRLQLARDLMTEDGVIFISIDDNEQAQLKLLCDSIFGERNFISNFIWRKKGSAGTDNSTISIFTEYLMCYSRNKEDVKIRKQTQELSGYTLKDEYYARRGGYKLNKLDRGTLGYHETLDYEIKDKEKNISTYPNNRQNKKNDGWRWRWSKNKLEWGLNNGFIEIRETKAGVSVYYKIYEKVDNDDNVYDRENIIPYSNIVPEYIGGTTSGTNELKAFFVDNVFEYPKPSQLIKHLVHLHQETEITVLDFFAGSGTTGQAVMELNKEDGGNRRFILCTNNEYQESKKVDIIHNNTNIVIDTKKNGEPSVKGQKELADFETTKEYQDLVERGFFEEIGICRAVTYERNKRVIQGYTTPKGVEVAGIPNNLSYYKVELEDTSKIDELDLDDYNYGMQERYLEIKEGIPKFEEQKYFSTSETETEVYIINKDDVFTSEIKDYVEKLDKDKEVYIYVTRDLLNDYILNELRDRVEVREIKENIKPKY